MPTQSEVVKQYLQEAHHALAVAEHNLDGEFYGTAVNRAYYAVFYTSTALLAAVGETRGKHSGVMSAFGRYFIKPGLLPKFLSEIYRRLLEHRERSDYVIFAETGRKEAEQDLQDARRFVAEAEAWLEKEDWL